MARALHRRGVLTKLRQSAGQDVEGGCGQLRARALAAADGVAVAVPRRGERYGKAAGAELPAA
jgi:23S rRNA (adenine2503-C2)-methyltransferase